MSILIKGIKMPKRGEKIIILTSSGYVEDVSGQVIQGAEAVELSLHGRLIDADALENKGADVCCSEGYYGSDVWGFSYDIIDDAPTIIEAEGKDDE